MDSGNFRFDKLRTGKSYIYLLLLVLGLVLFFLFAYCNPPGVNIYGDASLKDKWLEQFPDKPNRSLPIDTNKIVVPDDPFKRRVIADLINVYVDDTVNLKSFGKSVKNKYIDDSLFVTYYANEYKRIQFKVNVDKRDSLKKVIKDDFSSVKFTCLESVFSKSSVGSDPAFSNLETSWFYKIIGLYSSWDVTRGGQNVRVAVIDDSFDPYHTEFEDKFVKSWNVVRYDSLVTSYGGNQIHGTHVAGTVGGIEGNGFGLSGVAPEIEVMPIQIGNANGLMTTSAILDAIFYALKNKATVINMSLGMNLSQMDDTTPLSEQRRLSKTLFLDEEQMWDEVFKIALKEGCVIVQAAGNSNVLADIDPMKRSDKSIVVGACDQSLQKATFSNYGERVDVYAPGVNIYSSMPNDGFDKLNGTSMASPIIAGCIALMQSKKRGISISEIRELFEILGKNIQGDKAKLIQIDKILKAL